ncbi:MAG: PQQ-binding-like beta-propeller repeat protein [Planctomycetota bacterium]
MALASLIGRPALAQTENTVYVDDSPAAQSTLEALPALLNAGNIAEAVRSLQALLDDSPDRLLPHADDADLFVSVRSAIHARMLGSARLLERYRVEYSARAQRLLDQGEIEAVERSYLLTPAGYEAALRLAQDRYELARFDGAARTLLQLEDHPDLHADGGAAADLLSVVAAQLGGGEIRERAAAWRAAAGLPEADFAALRFEPPAAATRPTASVLAGGARPPSPPSRALWAQPYDRDLAPAQDSGLPPSQSADPRGGPFWIWPTIAGDTILLNDAASLSAWDRHSLRLRWRVTQTVDPLELESLRAVRTENTQTSIRVESPNIVAVDDRAAYASLGLHTSVPPDDDPAIVAVELESGRRLWRTRVRDVDAGLALGVVRGGPVADEGRVVFGVREARGAGRQVQATLVGLDALTGRPAWTRSLGSAGGGWSRSSKNVGAGGVVHDGVVYWHEPLSVVGAFDAQTGRPIWLRRFNAVPRGDDRNADAAWNVRQPIVIDDAVIVHIGPLDAYFRLDRETGELEGVWGVSAVDPLGYLVRVGEHVAMVGQSSIRFAEPGVFRGYGVRRVGTIREVRDFDRSITGRAVAAGDALLVPSGRAALLFDPETGVRVAQPIDLPRPGTLVPLADQLLVVDTSVMASLMDADTAAAALSERLRGDPSDMASLVSLVLLADRRRVLDEVPGAAARALRVFEALAGGDPAERRLAQAERGRLFAALLSIVERLSAGAELEAPGELADAIAQLALEAAGDTPERAAALLAVAGLRDRQGRGAEAAALCLEMLADERMRLLPLGPARERAGAAAVRTLRNLLPVHGYAIIEDADAAMLAALDALPPGVEGDAARLEIAVAMPASASALRAWRTLARHEAARGDQLAAARRWRRALDAARLLRTAGGPVDGGDVADIGAALAGSLLALDQVAAARRVVAELAAVSPIAQGDAQTLEQLRRRYEVRVRAARVGDRPLGVSQHFGGWRLVTPAGTLAGGFSPEHVVLASEDRMGVWAVSPDLGPIEGEPFEAEPAGPLELVWSSRFEAASPPTLLDMNSKRALFSWPERGSVTLRSVALLDAESWNSGPLEDLIPDALRPTVSVGPRATALATGGRRASVASWIIAAGDGVVLAARRDGLLLLLDAADGSVRFVGRTELGTAMDVAVAGGRAWVLGTTEPPGSPREDTLESFELLALDPASGEISYRVEGLAEVPRWIAAADDGSVALGLVSSIELHAPARSEEPVRWRSVAGPALDAAYGWIVGDRLAVFGPTTSELAVADLATGAFLGTPAALVLGDGEVPRVGPRNPGVGPGGLVALTSSGVTLIDEGGEIVGRDALRRTGVRRDTKAPPALGQDRVLIVPQIARSMAGGLPEYVVSTIDTLSAKITGSRPIRLVGTPRDAWLVDGYALISTDRSTVVLEMGR